MKKTLRSTSALRAFFYGIALLLMTTQVSWGQLTAIYTITSTTAVTKTGTAPSGSGATYAQTYATAKQLTSPNTATLTLSGYAGYVISSITLEMHSNTSAGAGSLSVVAGTTTISSVPTATAFNNAAWYGAWSVPYVNVIKTPTAYTVGTGENVVLKITASTNSLFIQTYSVTYAPATIAPTLTTPTATAITDVSATLGATVTADGGAALSARGTAYKTATGVIATDNSLAEGGTTVAAFSHSRTSLTPQTQYFYKGYATNSVGTGLSSEGSFRTWSSPPTAQAASLSGTGFSTTQVDLTIGTAATFPTSNATQGGYVVIYATGTPTFTATNGTAPSAGIGTIFTTTATGLPTAPATAISVTGLVAATSYNFLVVPYTWDGTNASTYNYLTTSAPTATASTTAGATVDWCNVQWPNTTQNILEGVSLDVYARVYEAGITNDVGQGANINAWVGYSATNQNPDTGSWTWVAATYNADAVNDDEYKATLTGITPGAYYYASRFQIGTGLFTYGGTGGVWNNDNVTLNVASNVVDFCNVQSPASGTITVGSTFDVYTQVYEPGTEPGGQLTGISAELGYSTENTNPNSVSGWTWATSTYNTDSENNDEYKTEIGLGRAIGTYYYASRFKKTGSTEYVYGGTAGVWNNDSGVLTVNASVPVVTAESPTGTYNAVFSYNILATNSPTSYAISNGTLPDYLSLNLTTGAITGTPSAAESFSVDVTATNSGGTSAPATLSFTIAKASQTITFAALANKTTIDLPFALAATASSALAVTYASSNEAVATISGSTVTIVGVGSTNITASQAGDSNYNAATDVVQSLIVELPPLITFDFVGIAGSETSVNSNSNAANIAVSAITRGATLTPAANADRFNATNWAITSIANAISGNNYVEFTISPNVGHMFSVSSILFQLQRSSTGFAAIALRSSVDNYATNLDAEKTVVDNTSTQSFTFAFTQINSLVPVIYRLYGYAEAVGGTGGPGDGLGNDIVVTGTVSCFTPTAYALTGGGNGCATTGVAVGLSNSQVGVNYQLKDGATTVGPAVAGTGSALSLGSPIAAGTYTVEATNAASECSTTATMTGSVVVTIDPASAVGTVSADQAICSGNSLSSDITITSATGTIQWQSADNAEFTIGLTDIGSDSTTLTIVQVGVLTATKYFRAVVTSGACAPVTSGTITVTIATGATTLIQDSNFENALISLGYDTCVDGKVFTANISGVISLNVANKSILDLTGIEDFTSLKALYCSVNALSTLNVSMLSNLIYLECQNNALTSLNITGLTTLETLVCFDNHLTTLDVSANAGLGYLDCEINDLTSINVSALALLNAFYCNNNQLTSLDLRGLTSLVGEDSFECKENPLLTCIAVDDIAAATTQTDEINWIIGSSPVVYSDFTCGATKISTTGTLAEVSTIYGTASAAPSSFTVSGANMTEGITVLPPAGFEVATTSDFSTTIGTNATPLVVGAAGTISSTTVYLRLSASAPVSGSPYSGNVVCSSAAATSVNVATVSSAVSTKALTITGLVADNKPYDGNNSATFSGTPVLNGIFNSDDVSLSGSGTATFNDATIANGKAVGISGYSLTGTKASNYTLTPPSLTANITKIVQTITFASLPNQNYGDASFPLTATASSTLEVTYVSSNTTVATISGNTVTIVGAGTTDITASQAGDASYVAAAYMMRSLTVNTIALTITGLTADNKTADGNATAILSGIPTLVGVLAGDASAVVLEGTPLATFASTSVGTAIAVTVTGYTLSGAAATNYTLAQPTGLTANITVPPTPAPTGDAVQSLEDTLTVGDIVVSGTDVIWYASESEAATATNPISNTTLLVTNTTYYATQTLSGLASTASLAVTVTTFLGVTPFDDKAFSFYPNPVKGILNLSYAQRINAVEVYNAVGQKIQANTGNDTTTQIDMSGFVRGAYFIKVTSDQVTKTIKIIKE